MINLEEVATINVPFIRNSKGTWICREVCIHEKPAELHVLRDIA